MEQKICFYCNSRLYQLTNGMVKCSSCAIKLNLSYQIVFNRYEHIRKLPIQHSYDYFEYKRDKLDDANSEVAHRNEFKKFMLTSHISKLKTIENTITKFWRFFEIFIRPYKGVKSEYFLSYLN